MKLIIHGGFFSESDTNQEIKKAKQEALATIAEASYTFLKTHSAVQTAVFAVSLLEDSDLFNAGYGSQIQSDGKIRMSAALMDGRTERFSGVINIEDVKNPIQVAEKDFPYFNPQTPQRKLEYEHKLQNSIRLGTVGCVVLDSHGSLAAATSTGGKGFEIPCRVSDSATVAGNYANPFAAVSCTGVGEDIVSGAVAAKIVTRVTDGFKLSDACEKTLSELSAFNGFAGIIGIKSNGEIYHADTHPYMVWASYDDGLQVFN